MIDRYKDTEIDQLCSEEKKLLHWQATELAVLKAMVQSSEINMEDYERIEQSLMKNPPDIDWWKIKDKEIHHDLNAFLQERLRFIPKDLQRHFHKGMTSYDTEEPAFAKMLIECAKIVEKHFFGLREVLKKMAVKYRYTVMYARTHGQGAMLQSFGKRCLTWLMDIDISFNTLKRTEGNLRFSKLSGAVGNYQGISPATEKTALDILGFKPQYGVTQIMPRELYAPIAQALCQIVATLNKMALTIRLGARSGQPIYQEPFGRKQTGSSAMPHKKNTISTEQVKGMYRMAKGYAGAIMENIETWEERAIEQSCVERVFWPDLFHVTVRVFKVMKRVLGGLVVYPDNMWKEIYDSRGCYASNQAKEILKEFVDVEDAYRIVQLAAFNAFEPKKEVMLIREKTPKSFNEEDELAMMDSDVFYEKPISIKEIILKGKLRVSPQLEVPEKKVKAWNKKLQEVFQNPENIAYWDQIFRPSYLLKDEETLYQQIL